MGSTSSNFSASLGDNENGICVTLKERFFATEGSRFW